ncbi:hypothetical protein [Salinimonas lutimaris]|uniref:hypothetical protein n=1 Tax=Salinimonas lutimaris TaxID=914153 RepID=UPI0010C15819|nr:hypothetical protein [Salinimonas lutimaris]
MPRLKRRKIEAKPKASIRHLARNVEWKIVTESGSPIDAEFISHIHYGERIFEQLLIWNRRQASKRATANNVLRYLKYVAWLDGAVSSRSLSDFKNALNTGNSAQANSKAQVFGMCRNFVSFLMSAEVIPTEPLPKNFKLTHKVAKPTIVELVRDAVADFARDHMDVVQSLMDKQRLKLEEASAVAYGSHILERYHSLSLDKIENWFEDCRTIDVAIESVGDAEFSELIKITDFRASKGDWRSLNYTIRSLPFAFRVLYANYGRLIPSSLEWPIGLADFCKNQGWPPRRIQAAFFTSAYNLQYFLVAALSHKELAPNVDSVAFYAYTNAFIPSSEKGMMSVHFGKKRGAATQKDISRKERICAAFYAYQNRLKSLLSKVPRGQEWLRKENCELFIHYTKNNGQHSIRTFDRSSTAHMVRRVTKEFASQHSEFEPLVAAKVTGENFRPTISALDILSGGTLGKLKHKLNHKSLSTTESYGVRVATQSIHDRKLKSFQDYLISNRNNNLPDTGTGYQCGQAENSNVVCSGVGMCFACEARRVVLKDTKLIAEWKAYAEWIKKNEQRLRFNNVERWDNHWQLKLAEYEALLAECTKAEVRAAETLARNIKVPFMD